MPSLPRWLERLLLRRHGGLVLLIAMFLLISLLIRLMLLGKAAPDVTWDASLGAAFGWGLAYDLGAAGFAVLPFLVVLTVLPARFFSRSWGRGLARLGGLAVIYALLFGLVAEWAFWDEFGVRFNFIAVDYLVYTKEVVGNIRETYNLPAIGAGLLAAALGLFWAVERTGWPARWLAAAEEAAGPRLRAGAVWLVGALLFGSLLTNGVQPDFRNNYNRELGRNGLWSLFAAFKANHLDYDTFYPVLPEAQVFRRLERALVADGAQLVQPGSPDTLRLVRHSGPELRPNIIQITVESLSAEFLGVYNPASRLTPALDALAPQSLVFENFYATGTRTDRGMEALALSLPPTPGRSLIKRPHNEQLFTLGSVLRAKGYDTAFLYGGYGYFDNMNYFFGHNGYRVIDRQAMPSADISFANIWGVCDEDLYRWTLREADAAAATGRPFHFFVMTTSNHRPYTYPEGRIDLPPKVSGRAGAVKYTDYAIGSFLRAAAGRPWFRNTVFVIVADHCASSAGEAELPVQNYHIPLLLYAPGGQIAPGRVATLTSQVDFAPTLLGLLNWSYASRFFGHDVRRIPRDAAHAFLGNYQKLALLKADRFFLLKPVAQAAQYHYAAGTNTLTPAPVDEGLREETISYYQAANALYLRRAYREVPAAEQARWLAAPPVATPAPPP